ncbi:LptM family lipoprotein [Bradyrhizobium sp. BR 1432]|uniref:LptM family lipoprotein n=1 Tax=Bradyrhizobium sp. BR 1432 TaxID=3447966 RepID=UPI003EE60452
MRRQFSLVILVAALPILSACGQPMPDDKAAYVGEWHAQAMDVELTKDGTVRYKRVRRNTTAGSTTISIDAPLRRFEGDNFVVGIPFLTATFEVSAPPHQEAGTWKMVVDGVELTRIP